jgi:hypothetical protein
LTKGELDSDIFQKLKKHVIRRKGISSSICKLLVRQNGDNKKVENRISIALIKPFQLTELEIRTIY